MLRNLPADERIFWSGVCVKFTDWFPNLLNIQIWLSSWEWLPLPNNSPFLFLFSFFCFLHRDDNNLTPFSKFRLPHEIDKQFSPTFISFLMYKT